MPVEDISTVELNVVEISVVCIQIGRWVPPVRNIETKLALIFSRSAPRHPCTDAGTPLAAPISTSSAHTQHPQRPEKVGKNSATCRLAFLQNNEHECSVRGVNPVCIVGSGGLSCRTRCHDPVFALCQHIQATGQNGINLEVYQASTPWDLRNGPGSCPLSSLSHGSPRHLASGSGSVENWGWRRRETAGSTPVARPAGRRG